ncbi:MAG: uroporphyrinogen-III synthase [Kordiimonadaceae bacterium]|nr:uroporphyrinogen-III synthase [Kordiimonadaceae bacterium]
MKTLLVTRPSLEAKPTGDALELKGHRAVYAPMLLISQVSFEIPDLERSLIVTSKNSVRFGLANLIKKDRPVFAVGEQTAAAARDLGFTNITVGPGTARKLLPILKECGIAQKRTYAHLCGNEVAYDICDALKQCDIDAINTVTYQTTPNNHFSPSLVEAFELGEIDGALFYSARTATIFEETIAGLGKHDWLRKIDAYCLSRRTADQLIGPWRTVKIASQPTEQAVFSLFD